MMHRYERLIFPCFLGFLLAVGLSQPAHGLQTAQPRQVSDPAQASGQNATTSPAADGPPSDSAQAEPTTPDSEENAADPNVPSPPIVSLPTAEELGQRIEAIQSNEQLSEELKSALLSELQAIRGELKLLADDKQQLDKLTKSAETVEERENQLEVALESEPTVPTPPFDDSTRYERLLEIRTEVDDAIRALSAKLESVQDTIRTRREEAKLLPQTIADLQTKIDELQAEKVEPAKDATPEQIQLARTRAAVALQRAKTSIALAQQKRRTYESESPVLALQEKDYERSLEVLREHASKVAQAFNAKRRAVVGRKIESVTANINNAELADNSINKSFLELLEDWPQIIIDSETYHSLLLEKQSQKLELKNDYATTEGLVNTDMESGRGLSRSVGLLLQRKKSKLASNTDVEELQNKVAVEMEETQEILTRIDAIADDYKDAAGTSNTLSEEMVASHLELLREMAKDADSLLLETLIPLGVELNEIEQKTEDFRDLIDEHLLWVRNRKTFSFSNLADLPDAWQWLFDPSRSRELLSTVSSVCRSRIDLVVAWVLLVIVLFAVRPWFSEQITQLSEETNRRLALKIRPTINSMLATAMVSVPWTVFLAGPGLLLSLSGSKETFVLAFGNALLMVAALLLPLEFMRQCLRPCGVAPSHFGWPINATRPLRRTLRWMQALVLPLLFLWRLFYIHADANPELSTASRLLFAALSIIASVLVWRVLHPRRGAMVVLIAENPDGWLAKLRWFWQPAIAAVPLSLAVLTMFGYSYSAAQLAARLYRTIWIVLLLGLAHGLLARGISVSRRKMKLQQIREKQDTREVPTGVEGNVLEIPEEQLDVSAMNAQTQRVLTALTFFTFLLGVYLTWRDVLPALGFLNQFTLWSITDADGVTTAISLANALAALPIVVLTVVFVRNVPGLLETTLLQKLPLENAVRYAITTLTSYTIAGIGIVWTASTLGLRWDSIQWLVAGLGVGLGFGLQAIFANFISGIILLFEQPIRVGDIVTLDGTTGVVSRIRMRATTITNWDRQEFVVPNQDFITGRLVNWTLSDTTNRVVINVGVAYGTDTRATCDILSDICKKHDHVLDDPAPLITFEGFGDSTLNIVLRFYLASLDHRLAVIHEMHTLIHERFNEAGIEIAFPQQDLHVRSLPESLTKSLSIGLLEDVPGPDSDRTESDQT